MPIFDDQARRAAVLFAMAAALAGCDRAPDNRALAAAEDASARRAAQDGRIACAMDGAALFDQTCTVEQMNSSDGIVLIVGRQDAGYRRLLITGDGRGLVSADGADAAIVRVTGDGMIEVEVGKDRFRLPATIKAGA